MTVEPRICPSCGQPVEAGATFCTVCGEQLPRDGAWPTWHGTPTSNEPVVHQPAPVVEDDAGFKALALDPQLTNEPSSVAGSRWQVGWFLLAVVAWIVAEIMFRRGDPAAYWDVIWYAAAVGTVTIGAWLLAVTWRRARTHGWSSATRRLVA